MREMLGKKVGIVSCVWLILALMVTIGCQSQYTYEPDERVVLTHIHKLVVVGFDAALSQGEQPDVVRDPISGTVFMAEPVPKDAVQRMSNSLFDIVAAEKGYEVIPPGYARRVFSSIISSQRSTGLSSIKVLQEVGKSFAADAVLVGSIYRWREREGTDYAVNRPASVAFNLHLISTAEARILWKAKFDKTQQSLSENILDLATFRESGGRWITAEKLGILGLQKSLALLPARRGPHVLEDVDEQRGP